MIKAAVVAVPLEDQEDLAGFFDVEDGPAESAIYREQGQGPGIPVAVIPSQPDETFVIQGQPLVREINRIRVMVSEVPNLAKGDTFTWDGVFYRVSGEPRRDDVRGTWVAGLTVG